MYEFILEEEHGREAEGLAEPALSLRHQAVELGLEELVPAALPIIWQAVDDLLVDDVVDLLDLAAERTDDLVLVHNGIRLMGN